MGNFSGGTLREDFAGMQGEGLSEAAWESLIDKPTSISDVFEAVSSEDVEALLLSSLPVVQDFLRKAVAVLDAPFTAADPSVLGGRKLNALRYLTRIVPVVHRHKELQVQALFWGPDDFLAPAILQSTLNSAFMKGFGLTLESEEDSETPQVLWYPGLGATSPGACYGVEENQGEILRCLLACTCSTVYSSASEIEPNSWLSLLVHPGLPHTSDLVFSLLNAVINYRPDGVMSLLNFTLMSQEVVTMSAQLLAVMLHYTEERGEQRVSEALGRMQFEAGALSANVALDIVRRLRSEADFCMLLEALTRLLSRRRDLGIEEEVLLLTWLLLCHSPAFTHSATRQPQCRELLVHLLALMWTAEEQAGPLQVAAFILLLLSSQRAFCLHFSCNTLNTDLGISLPKGVISLFDVLIVLTQRLSLVKSHVPLVPVLLSVLSNANYFVKSIGPLASADLVSMLKAFSAARTLWGDPISLQIVRSLVEIVSSRLQYYWAVGAM